MKTSKIIQKMVIEPSGKTPQRLYHWGLVEGKNPSNNRNNPTTKKEGWAEKLAKLL